MKTLGLLGGMTYGATGIYYRLINSHIQRAVGGATSAPLLLHSFNHAETSALFTAEDWPQLTTLFSNAGLNLKASGANALMICCNIGHKIADQVEQRTGLPVLHIADFTAEIVRDKGVSKVALIGTRPVMEQSWFRERLGRYGIDVVVPSTEKRLAIHDMIFQELGANVFREEQKDLLKGAIEETRALGAEGVVFACTELQFVVKPGDVDVPIWDTMEAHAVGAADWALKSD